MAAIIACALEIPGLEEALRARGLCGVPIADLVPGKALATLAGWTPESEEPADRLARLRARGWRAPFVLAAPGRESAVRALDAGADDAVALPASACEIAARIASRLRTSPAPITLGALDIDPVERRVRREGRPIALLPREYALLLHLARRGGECVGRAQLLRAVWGLGFDPGTNVVEVHVSRLRAKLDRGFATAMLRTEKGRGYRLSDQGSSAMSAA